MTREESAWKKKTEMEHKEIKQKRREQCIKEKRITLGDLENFMKRKKVAHKGECARRYGERRTQNRKRRK